MKMCRLEKICIAAGFVLVHDGQRNPGQFQLPPDEVKCFTRKYRWKIDGELVNTWAVFRYDSREGSLAEFELSSKEPGSRSREEMILSNPELLETEEPLKG